MLPFITGLTVFGLWLYAMVQSVPRGPVSDRQLIVATPIEAVQEFKKAA